MNASGHLSLLSRFRVLLKDFKWMIVLETLAQGFILAVILCAISPPGAVSSNSHLITIKDLDGTCAPSMLEVCFLLPPPLGMFNSCIPAFVIVDWLIRLHKAYVLGGLSSICQMKLFMT